MQTPSSRSRSSSSSRSGPPTFAPTSHSSSPDRSTVLHDDDHRTIAYIAPTILKTNDVQLGPFDPTTQFPGVELVYVPPIRASKYSPYLRADSLAGTPDIYERQTDYFDPRGSSPQSSPISSTGPNTPTVGIPPASSKSVSEETIKSGDWNVDYSDPLIHSEPLPIPDGLEISQTGNPFDLVEEPDFMEDFPKKGVPTVRTRSVDGQSSPGFVRYAQGGAESVNVERCNPEDGEPGRLGPVKQDHIIRPPEHLSTAVSHKPSSPIQRASSYDQVPLDNKLLAPPDTIVRGRSSSSSCINSVSGSTTSPSTSHTRSSDSRSESRGRSSTRNSSFSDRERSNSRSSRSNGSPIGSISPCGSTIGIGGQSSGRESRSVYNQPGRERGRDRTGRRINGSSSSSSLSPPDVSSPTRGVDYIPVHTDSYSSLHDSMSQSIVSSTDSTSSTVGPNSDSTSTQGNDHRTGKGESLVHPQPQPIGTVVSTSVHSRPSKSSRTGLIIHPSPIPEEEEVQRSRNPTPANSPTVAFKPLPVPDSTDTSTEPTVDVALNPDGKHEIILEDNQHAGLVGRAVEMVNSARGLIGSLWHPGPL